MSYLLVVDGSHQSRQAAELLTKFRIPFRKQTVDTFSSIEVFSGDPPYLVTPERGSFEGLAKIVEFLQKKGNLAMTEPKLPPPPFATARGWKREFPQQQEAPPPANVEEALAEKEIPPEEDEPIIEELEEELEEEEEEEPTPKKKAVPKKKAPAKKAAPKKPAAKKKAPAKKKS